jgi:hypothetical protein
MTVYLIQDTTVTLHTTDPEAIPADALLVRCEEDLAGSALTVPQLTALWSALSGNTLTRHFRSRGNALRAVWVALCRLGAAEEETAQPLALSKQALLIALLRRDGGATLDDLTAATGWQRHSVRGALAGALKRRLGLTIVSTKTDAGRTYRIVEAG